MAKRIFKSRIGWLEAKVKGHPNAQWAMEQMTKAMTEEEREQAWIIMKRLWDVLDQSWARELPFSYVALAVGASLPEKPRKTKPKPKKLTSEKKSDGLKSSGEDTVSPTWQG